MMRSIRLSKLTADHLASVLRAKTSARWCFFAALLVTMAVAWQVRAQVAASITGVVTDPSGAPIPTATGTTKNLETGAVRSATADDAGRYLMLALPGGQ